MPRKILIVDDDKAIANLTALRLRALGYDIDVAFDGTSGLAKARTNRPDLILLDVRMPDLDGFQVCESLRAETAFSDIPVIFLSANVQDAAKRKASALGAMFLPKPYEMDDVLAAIDHVTAAKTICGDAPELTK